MSYWIYYQPSMVIEGHTGDSVEKVATIEDAFLLKYKLEQDGHKDIRVFKEIKLKVELVG